MDNHELFSAIGNVDDTYLLELEQPKLRRLPKHFGLIAALIALLLTACAAPAIVQHFDALHSGGIVNNEFTVTWDELWKDPESRVVNGDYIILHPNTVCVDVTVAEDAPETLVQIYVPLSLLDYASIETGTQTETSLSLELSTKVPRYGKVRGIFYQQHALPKDGHIELDNFVDTGIMKESMKTYGNISVLEIEGNTCYPLLDSPWMQPAFYTKHIFWSDGNYLFCLKLPVTYYLPVTEVEGIVSSLTAVDDITQYLTAE